MHPATAHLFAACVVVAGCAAAARSGERSGAGAPERPPSSAAAYVGSEKCGTCHHDIYERWRRTPMANVVRDPRREPGAIAADLTTNTIHPFRAEDVALVYGSRWKQRYFTKIGDDYFVQPAQWDITNRVWRKYFVAAGTDWWAGFYPPDNMKRPTGPLCDGCHSVGYDTRTRRVAEWNVGCERCHGVGAEHVAHPSRHNVINPARLDHAAANDTCVQCHSQGRPISNPIDGRYYDWPVGYDVGKRLADFWRIEEHPRGESTFTHFADGTAHKNRMQGNDYERSTMYRAGVTCFDCHDPHGTANPAQLRAAGNALCAKCHAPGGPNGPRAPTIDAHTHHPGAPAANECVACHMPKIETTIADVNVRAHTFEVITPAMSEVFNVPNPCNGCHHDKSTAWAGERLSAWRTGPSAASK